MILLFLGALLLLTAGGVLALAAGRLGRVALLLGAGSAIAGSAAGAVAAVGILLAGSPMSISLPWLENLARLDLLIDGLAAFFLLPVFLLGLLCAVYGIGYQGPGGGGSLPGAAWFFYNLLIASMALVVSAANAVLFLVAWEIMSLASFFLVASDHTREEVRQAAWQYLLATHLGTACLFAFFLILGNTAGQLDFAAFQTAVLPPGLGSLLFALALLGFGTKAGLFPLHVWLPNAHPAAPSHVSALMSGVMVKTGIYGVLRMLTIIRPEPVWWGAVLMGLGAAGALFGIVMAAQQQDLKRSLAYSTIDNIGIIFLALGLAIFGTGRHLPQIAQLAMAGGLLHIWSHALFKGLLFLGAGSILHATGSRNLEQMGGLLRRLPVTSTLLLGGCLAICGLPPLNGFVGEWLIYLGMLKAGLQGAGFTAFYPLLGMGALSLTGGLTLLVFTRMAGIVLLGEPRQAAAAAAHEAPWLMLLPMAALLGLCLGIGLAPELFYLVVSQPAALLLPETGLHPAPFPAGATLGIIGRIAFLLLAGTAAVWLLFRRYLRGLKITSVATWGCGYSAPTSRMAYTAAGYAELAQETILPAAVRPEITVHLPAVLFPPPGRLLIASSDPVCSGIFRPFFGRIAVRLTAFRWLQGGRLNEYLLYIFITLALLLGWTAWRG